MSFKPRYIVLHHSASPPDTTLKEVDRWHKARQFKSPSGIHCGYHFVISQPADAAPIIEAGRPLTERGAHLKPERSAEVYNSNSFGICITGQNAHQADNYNPSTPGQILQAVEMIATLCRDFDIPAGNVRLHKEERPTLCPGFDDMYGEFIRGAVAELLEGESE